MNRYRWVLAIAIAAVIAAVALVAVFQPSPADQGAATGSKDVLIPVADRQQAPEFTGITGWINSPPLQLGTRHTGATLIDFWTYSCVNCVRTVPGLGSLYARYGGNGFQIVGVHSPEFDFEKNPDNVRRAVSRLGVTWPVALDPDMATWNAWSNQYWPAEYLVDSSNRIAYVHFGEGDQATLEAAVRELVGPPVTAVVGTSDKLPGTGISPELYAGGQTSQQHQTPLGDGEVLDPSGAAVDLPATAAPAVQRDAIEVSGPWRDRGDHLESAGPGHVRLRFHAREVYVVAGSNAGPLRVAVSLDGRAVDPGASGSAVSKASATVAASDLYHLLSAVPAGDHVLDLAVPAGFVLYTFTFG
ncbi:MAG TPA: redoxin family protein [Candidatus Dormibacteraeota bacterium]